MVQVGVVLGGRYILDERIGIGGYGEVWRATDTVLSRPVALKLLHQRHAEQAETVARFRSEAQHAAALSHENIAQVYDYGEAAGGQPPYLVMELVTGASLETLLEDGPLDATRTMDIVAQAAAGLQTAHAAGMIHRDVKPGNLLLDQSGTVKITDFGLAHTVGSVSVTASGELVGTPGYLAPERAVGDGAGPASDLYSLGIVAYECLAGARPFSGTPLEVALAHRDRPLPPLPVSVATDVAAFVMRLAAKDPASRPGDAAEVTAWAGLLRDGVGAGLMAGRRAPATPPQERAWAYRRAILVYACAAFAAVIVIVVASVIGFASPSRPAAASPAQARADASAPAAVPSSAAAPTSSPPAAPAPRDRGGRDPSAPPPQTSPAPPPPASPPPHQPKAPQAPVAETVHPGHGGGDPGNGNGPGKDNGKGTGNGKGSGNGNG